MSWGTVMCSKCHREVHQDGDKSISKGWRHCNDKTTICDNAKAVYPTLESDISGNWCGSDGGVS